MNMDDFRAAVVVAQRIVPVKNLQVSHFLLECLEQMRDMKDAEPTRLVLARLEMVLRHSA